MRKPNFFILGAPKCGTTSLTTWLAEHPQVFISPAKEPHFFNFDFGERSYRTLGKYEKLFVEATRHHIAVGEASVRYLYSRTAVPAILAYAPEPRFVVMVRNPVEMAYAMHDQNVCNAEEDERNFSAAWDLQAVRVYGDCVPNSVDPQVLLYGKLCKVGLQIQQLLGNVSRSRVLIVNLHDVNRDPRREYLKVLEFLNLEDDGRTLFPIVNAAKERYCPLLWRTVRRVNTTLRTMGVPHWRIGFTEWASNALMKQRPRPGLTQSMRRHLCKYFAEDVVLLEEMTGWDLSEWKTVD